MDSEKLIISDDDDPNKEAKTNPLVLKNETENINCVSGASIDKTLVLLSELF